MWNSLGAYQPNFFLLMAVFFVVVVLWISITVGLYSPNKNSQMKIIDATAGIVAVICVITFAVYDAHCVQQFADEGTALRTQWEAMDIEAPLTGETLSFTLTCLEYNEHLTKLKKSFHFPTTALILKDIQSIDIFEIGETST